MALAFAETYQDIPGSTLPRGPVDVPVEIIDRTERLAQVQVDIKNDLANDIAFVEKAVIGPLMEARSYLKPILKYIQKRDDKKLDYEKFYKLVENYKAKPNPSRREQSILAKGELDLEEATIVSFLRRNEGSADSWVRHIELLMTRSGPKSHRCFIVFRHCFQ